MARPSAKIRLPLRSLEQVGADLGLSKSRQAAILRIIETDEGFAKIKAKRANGGEVKLRKSSSKKQPSASLKKLTRAAR